MREFCEEKQALPLLCRNLDPFQVIIYKWNISSFNFKTEESLTDFGLSGSGRTLWIPIWAQRKSNFGPSALLLYLHQLCVYFLYIHLVHIFLCNSPFALDMLSPTPRVKTFLFLIKNGPSPLCDVTFQSFSAPFLPQEGALALPLGFLCEVFPSTS